MENFSKYLNNKNEEAKVVEEWIRSIRSNPTVYSQGRYSDPNLSALIATASIIVKYDDDIEKQQRTFEISRIDLNLPGPVKANLRRNLQAFLSAAQLDGFQENVKRKAFVVGNTGR